MAKAIVSWSTGKDSAFALHLARRELDVVGLVTTVTTAYGRVSMHGVREGLLARQVAATGLPCRTIGIPSPCSNDDYERELVTSLAQARDQGVTRVVFGDLFLADVRAYREALLARVGMTGVFPLWQRDTHELARDMLAAGVRAILTCVDPRQLATSFAGRSYDAALLAELPAGVDPCGERGEFHTFVTDGPMLRAPIAVQRGEVVVRDGFAFADLIEAGEQHRA